MSLTPDLLALLLLGVLAGTLSGIVGTGSAMLLMPLLVWRHGPQQAVPIMAIASVMGNLGKVLAWRREVDWRAVGAYGATALPGAALGARTLLVLPAHTVDLALGVFFIAMIPLRRALARRISQVRPWHLALIGAPIGFLTGIVVSTGPITVAVFASYGLVKGAFIATEAAASILVYGAKVVVFRSLGALPGPLILMGLATGAALMTGSFVARRIVAQMSPHAFGAMVDALMLFSGLSLLVMALRG